MTPDQKRREWAAALDLDETMVRMVITHYDAQEETLTYHVIINRPIPVPEDWSDREVVVRYG